MNKILKRLLLGLLIWFIPFIVSIFVWDPVANGPKISQDWFNAIMAFFWALGFAIAAYVYFKDIKKDTVAEGWKTGLTWYVEPLVLDLVVLVGLFGMTFTDYYQFLLVYLNSLLICVSIGYIKKK